MAKSSQPTSWRKVLRVHPAAGLFPMMSPDELLELGEDIKKQGLRVPVAVSKNQKDAPPKLLDGRNRLDAMEAVGIAIRVESVGTDSDPHIRVSARGFANDDMWRPIEVTETNGDPCAYVISANIHRRHLTAEQKRGLIGKLLKATPEKSNRQIADTVKASHVTVGSVRTELETTGQIDQLKKTTGKDGKSRSRSQRPTAALDRATDRIIERKNGKPSNSPDDIGPYNSGEITGKNAEVDDLRNAKRRLEIEIAGLRGEVEELKTAKHQLEVQNAELVRQLEEMGKKFTELRDKFVAVSRRTATATADFG